MGGQLANWLIQNKIVEHIFGPNLHVELIKQSQVILNFLAIEGRITNDHIDVIWAAGQVCVYFACSILPDHCFAVTFN